MHLVSKTSEEEESVASFLSTISTVEASYRVHGDGQETEVAEKDEDCTNKLKAHLDHLVPISMYLSLPCLLFFPLSLYLYRRHTIFSTTRLSIIMISSCLQCVCLFARVKTK